MVLVRGSQKVGTPLRAQWVAHSISVVGARAETRLSRLQWYVDGIGVEQLAAGATVAGFNNKRHDAAYQDEAATSCSDDDPQHMVV